MIRTTRPLRLMLPVLLALSGCQFLKPQSTVDIDALRTEHRYSSALTALEKQHSKNPAAAGYLDRRQSLLDEATLYQSQLLQTLRGLMEQSDFAQAQYLLQQALPELPSNAELTAFSDEFNRARNRYVQNRLDELYQLRGEHLLQEQALYKSLQGAASDYELQIAVERFQADAEYFGKLLREAGTAAMQREDYVAAKKYLSTANQLRPSTEIADALTIVQHAIDARRETEQQNRANEREQRYRKIETNLQQALGKADFTAARTLLGNLRDIGLHGNDVERYRKQLNDSIGSYVGAQTDAGNKLYAEGHIEAALDSWRNAYTLTPTPELKERIEKAEKFMQRYQHLKETPLTGIE